MKRGLWAVCVAACAAFSSLNSTARGQYVTQLDASNHVPPISAGITSHPSSRGVLCGDYFYYIADNPYMDGGIWRTDGTPQGTSLVYLNPKRQTSPFGGVGDRQGFGSNALFRGPGGCVLGLMKSEDNSGLLIRIDEAGIARSIYPNLSTDSPIKPSVSGEQENLFSSSCVTGNKVFFLLNHAAPEGTTLWVTDGTPDGTRLVQSFGPLDLNRNFCKIYGAGLNGRFVFSNNSSNGRPDNPWISDGTPSGTRQIADINPAQPAGATQFAALGDYVYFIATAPDNRSMVFRTDGTAEGTAAICPAPPMPSQPGDTRPPIATSYAIFYYGGTLGNQLWAFNGSDVRNLNLPLLRPGEGGNAMQTTVVNDRLYHVYNTTLRRIDPGFSAAMIANSGAGQIGEMHFLSGDAGQPDRWLFNGTHCFNGSQTISLLPAFSTGNARILGTVRNRFVFAISDFRLSPSDRELYSTDGTVNGTVPLGDIGTYGAGTTLTPLVSDQGMPYFRRSLLNGGMYPAAYNIARITPNGQLEVLDTPGIPSNDSFQMWPLGDRYVCVNRGVSTSLDELLTAPTPAGPFERVATVNAGILRQVGSKLFFAECSSSPCSLWVTDGSRDGTFQISNELFIDAFELNNQTYVTTSTAQNTTRISRFADNVLTHVDERVGLFSHYASTTSRSLLRSSRNLISFDGNSITPLTVFLSNIVGVAAVSDGSRIFIPATTNPSSADSNIELYVTDGTPTGTRLVKDINPGLGNSYPQNLTIVPSAHGSPCYFTAFTTDTGRELWVSDGTPEGTVPVVDLNPGAMSSSPNSMIEWNGQLLFMAFHPEHGHELFISDGTAQGTRLFHEFVPGVDGVRCRGVDISKDEHSRVFMNVYLAGNEYVDPYMISDRCAADFNADGELDIFDYLDFVAAFASGDPASDFNGDSVLDLFDYLDFVRLYSGGC